MAVKVMVAQQRDGVDGNAEQSCFQGMMIIRAILVRFPSLDVSLLVSNEGNGREDTHAVSAVMRFHEP